MILKGFGECGDLLLKGLVQWWYEVLLTLRRRLATLSLTIRNFILTLRPLMARAGGLTLPRRVFLFSLRVRSFMLHLPKPEE